MSFRFVATLIAGLGLLLQVSLLATRANNASANDGASCFGDCRGTLPTGFNGFLVFMTTGALPLAQGFFLDGKIFQEQIMKRTPVEIAQNRAAALAYFQTRFGIDAENNPDINFFGFYVDPRIDTRAYVISGRRVPSEGYLVHDGGWIAIVTNPNGITLGGDFAGRHVPQNTMFSFGDYSIEVTRSGRGPKPKPIVIHFRCNNPLVPLFNGGEAFDCDLTSDEFGSGLAQGVNSPIVENGVLHPHGRNVLTFSPRGGR